MAFVLLTTKDIGVYLPPEVFESRPRALIEADHLCRRLGGVEMLASVDLPATLSLANDRLIHLLEVDLAERSNESLWLGVEHDSSGTRPLISLITGDDPEAIDWLLNRVGLVPRRELVSCFYETRVFRDHRELYVGVHHLKQVGNL